MEILTEIIKHRVKMCLSSFALGLQKVNLYMESDPSIGKTFTPEF